MLKHNDWFSIQRFGLGFYKDSDLITTLFIEFKSSSGRVIKVSCHGNLLQFRNLSELQPTTDPLLISATLLYEVKEKPGKVLTLAMQFAELLEVILSV